MAILICNRNLRCAKINMGIIKWNFLKIVGTKN